MTAVTRGLGASESTGTRSGKKGNADGASSVLVLQLFREAKGDAKPC